MTLLSSNSSSCYYDIHDIRCIRHTIGYITACNIATSLVHSRLDYCNSLYHSLPITQHKRLQQIQNEPARAVTRTPKHSLITPALKSLHWLKANKAYSTKSYHLLTIFSINLNHHICVISSISNSVVKLAPLTTSACSFPPHLQA